MEEYKLPPNNGRKFSQALKASWEKSLDKLESFDLSITNTRSRTLEENKAILCTLKLALKLYLQFINDKN
jgi:hypothetical protein